MLRNLFICIIFLFYFVLSAFSQGQDSREEAMMPYYPNTPPSQKDSSTSKPLHHPDLELLVKPLKQGIKKDHYFSTIIAYKAARYDNVSVCSEAAAPQECEGEAGPLIFAHRLVDGDCQQLDDNSLKTVCFSVTKKECSGLAGWQRDMCSSFLKEDASLLRQAMNSSDFRVKFGKSDEGLFRKIMASYAGFKYYRQSACDKFSGSTGSIPNARFMCEVIFGSRGVEDAIDGIASDIAYFTYAKQNRNNAACEKIKDFSVRSACTNSAIRGIEQIWE